MSNDYHLNNARSVVQAWAEGRHTQAWDPQAHSSRPSELFMNCAEAFSSVRQVADDQADMLRGLGFQPSHPEVSALRELASTSAHRATRHIQWAEALAEAEKEIDYGSHDDE